MPAIVWLVISACLAIPGVVCAIEPDFLMDSDPTLELPKPVANFKPELKSLWLMALKRPEADMQRMAAETIARGHTLGVPGLSEAVPELERILESEASHPTARFAAAHALITLDSQRSSDKLFAASQTHGADFRSLVEPTLARWDYAPAIVVWTGRLSSLDGTRRDLALAIRGLAQVREASAVAPLVTFVSDITRDPAIRLEAATAVGQIADMELEQAAERLVRDTRSPSYTNQLCAIRFLSHHSSDAAQKLLTELTVHEDSVVASAAYVRLNEIDPTLVLPLAESALKSRHPQVRLQGINAYVKLPNVDRVTVVGQLLDDSHAGVRQKICESLLVLAEQPEWHDAICDVAMQVLARDKNQREAALLLGSLEHKPAAARLVELLEADHREVMLAAAWALRKIAVPETIPALIDKAQRQTERRQRDVITGLDLQVAHLFEALGAMKAKAAEPLLRQYVSKDHYTGNMSRGAAIWAIGQIKAGSRDEDLENELLNRITDNADQQPETPRVKQMSLIALGRMQATDQGEFLKGLQGSLAQPLQLAAALRWTVKELTGEELPRLEPVNIDAPAWFLEPFE